MVEILVAIAILAVLVSALFIVSTRVTKTGEVKLAESTIRIIATALEQFNEYDYGDYDFPPDCNGFIKADLETALSDFVGVSPPGNIIKPIFSDDSGSMALYFCLNMIPPSREIINSLSDTLLDKDNDPNISISGKRYPLLKIVDPWEKSLRYVYDANLSFPIIMSAGPDGVFDMSNDDDDDIDSRKLNLE